MSVIVSYNGAPHRSDYRYLINVGYHNGVVNLRTFSPVAKPLTINEGREVTREEAVHLVNEIVKQFKHEDFNYVFENT